MANKHFFAFVCVLALLGINVGAYYLYWPHNPQRTEDGEKSAKEERGELRVIAGRTEKKVAPAKADERAGVQAQIVPPPVSGDIPILESNQSEGERIRKLIDHIRGQEEQGTQEKVKPSIAIDPNFPPAEIREPIGDRPIMPGMPVPDAPKPLPWVQSEPLSGSSVPAKNSDIAITAAITPKLAPGLWVTSVEKVGNRTILTARLRPAESTRVVAEFVIQCDRVESVNGSIQTVGQVTFRGAGVTGVCGRLTIPMHEPRILFEGNVQVALDSANTGAMGHGFTGDRFSWQPTYREDLPVRPASLGPPR